MPKIIRFDTSKKRPKQAGEQAAASCEHRQVIAYTHYRTVYCAVCGFELDPFDVLVDMLKAHVPAGGSEGEEQRLLREVKRRETEKSRGKRNGRK